MMLPAHPSSNNVPDPHRKGRRRKSSALTFMQQMTSRTVKCGSKADTRDTIQAQFRQISKDVKVETLVVENLLSRSPDPVLLSVVEALVFANDRTWQSLRFQDHFDVNGFWVWLKEKSAMMMEFESYQVHLPTSKLYGVLGWRSTLTLTVGTPVKEIMRVFKEIKDDPDVLDMTLVGANPKNLADMIDWNDDGNNTLMTPLTIHLECGWATKNRTAGLSSHKKFLNVCMCLLGAAQRQNTQTIKRTNSQRSLGLGRNSPQSQQRAKPERLNGRSKSSKNGRSMSPMRKGSPTDPPTRQSSSKSLGSLSPRRNGFVSPKKRADGAGKATERRRVRRIVSESTQNLRPSLPNNLNGQKSDRIESACLERKSADSPLSSSPNQPVTSSKELTDGGTRGNPAVISPKKSSSKTDLKIVGGEPIREKKLKAGASYWRSAVDATSGKTYYYHKKTKETMWKKPPEMIELEKKQKLSLAAQSE